MKTKTLFYRILHACLMIAIVGNVLMISPSQTVSAKPLAAPYTGCASPSQQSQIPETECEALVAFYNSTNGPTWNYHSGWLQTNMPCYWEWVTCDNQTNVTSLYLPWNQLTGSLPPELGNLTYLTSLDLDYNQLSGPIPPELGSLTTLTSLSVYDNQLSGSIPAELGNLKNLTDLNLMENKLSGPIPSELGGMTNLSDLALNYNQLSGSIPPELGNLANLTGLGLTGNQLSGPIPTELGNLINLNYLYISGNELTGDFPTSITNLVNLHWLEIDECQGLTSSDPAVIAFIGQLVDQDWQCLPRITNVSPIEGGLSGGKKRNHHRDGLLYRHELGHFWRSKRILYCKF
jgi:Leucine-rich repeat (LRR) protein